MINLCVSQDSLFVNNFTGHTLPTIKCMHSVDLQHFRKYQKAVFDIFKSWKYQHSYIEEANGLNDRRDILLCNIYRIQFMLKKWLLAIGEHKTAKVFQQNKTQILYIQDPVLHVYKTLRAKLVTTWLLFIGE